MDVVGWRIDFLEREREPLLSRFLANSTSDFFGAKIKVVLHGEAYVWTPVLGSFDKFCEVRDLSYLVYFRFKCFD